MIKQKLFYQERGSIAIYAITTTFSFLIILSAIFISSSVIRKDQLRTIYKIKEVYAKQLNQADEIIENRSKMSTDGYVTSGLQVFYDAINNTGSGHNNNTKIWRDLSGNGNDAKWNENDTGLTWNDKSYDFINPNNNYFTSIKEISLGTSSRTIELVCSLEEDGVESILGLGYSVNNNELNDLIYYNNGINLNVKGNTMTEGIDEPFDIGRTYATTITYDGTNHTTNYYKNADSKTDVTFNSLNTGSSTITIGKGNTWDHNTNKRFKIQAVRIYNRILTAEERRKNYELDRERYEIEEEKGVVKFGYTGAVQEWTVPETGKYKLEVWGAQGGNHNTNKAANSGTGDSGKGRIF